jgi:N-sulfoglucosamine sulfohydrolase
VHRNWSRRQFGSLATGTLAATLAPAQRRNLPNVLWITSEDMGNHLRCYGFPHVRTPHIDSLAAGGVRFNHCFTTAPVCSAARSAWMTGMYQTTIGAHHHRSHRTDGYRLPQGARLVTARLRDLGYFTCNVRKIANGVQGSGKTDLNFNVDRLYDGEHWSQRAKGQPFFAHINFQAPHKGPAFVRARRRKELVDPASLQLPPWWPDHPLVRDEFANYLDAVQLLDDEVGATLGALKNDGLFENTIVFLFGDNGTCLIRGKQWLYDFGIQVPFIVRWPGGAAKPGTVRDDLVSSIDWVPTLLHMIGAEVPAELPGRPLFDAGARAPEQIYAARDRCDMTIDRIRCIRTDRYKYIRNFMPDQPYTQYNEYIQRSYPTLSVMKELHAAGKLSEAQQLFMAERKPDEELYDLRSDPHEVRNLAGSSEQASTKADLRAKLDRWIEESNDRGRFPEGPRAAML